MALVPTSKALTFFQKFEERGSIVSVYLDLLVALELCAVCKLAELMNAFICTRGLLTKLVARKIKYFETLRMIGLIKFLPMDVGGIQRTIQLWIHGDCTNVTIQFDGDGTYSMGYTDTAGNEQFRAGGGVEITPDGSEIPLSEEELLEYLMMPDVEYKDDGSVWVYWLDQKVDITDKFVDGLCYVKLVKDEETMYVTVKYKGGYAADYHKFADPDSWGCE